MSRPELPGRMSCEATSRVPTERLPIGASGRNRPVRIDSRSEARLHIDHHPRAILNAKEAFIRLIDHAIIEGGSYYLTYHRFARRDQVIACHPSMPSFLATKQRLDPTAVFQSDWYRHLVALLAGELPC
jgi:hypothetical protein